MDKEKEVKAEEYLRTILADNDKASFTREDVCQLLKAAWSDGYDEGAYDFSDKVSTSRLPFCDYLPNPLTSIQAERLAKQFQAISKICDNNEAASELAEMLLQDLEASSEQIIPTNLASMVECWGDKLKRLRIKTDERQSNS